MSISTEATNQIFKLSCNEHIYEFPAETFARVSKKCAALLKAGDYQANIVHPVSVDAF